MCPIESISDVMFFKKLKNLYIYIYIIVRQYKVNLMTKKNLYQFHPPNFLSFNFLVF